MPIPPLEPLDEYFSCLSQMVAKTSRLPHWDTVRALGRAAFPTSRETKEHKRLTYILDENRDRVGMYDDNTTPRWAILWAHGIGRVSGCPGWEFAHVWPASDDINCYTHLANLAMVPECLASLTDKNGPLTGYLRWHAWAVYGWKPERTEPPQEPKDYSNIQWRYLPKFDTPRRFVDQRLAELRNERVRTLRAILGGKP